MKYAYVVTLKNKQTVYIDWIGILLSVISMAFFTWEMITGDEVGVAMLLGALFIAGVLSWNAYHAFYRHQKVYYSRALLIAALVWMKMPYYQGLSIPLIVLALLEYQAKYAIEIGFAEEHILLNHAFKKKIAWSSLQRVVLKDGLLTFDYLNNKLWQKEVDEEDDYDADEDEFNAWCKEQTEKAARRST